MAAIQGILMNEYKKEIILARKKFRTEQPMSSHDSDKSPFTNIIFYEVFVHYPITLEGGFKVYPKEWALAFLQPDIRSVAKILCESVFTEQELKERNSSGAKMLTNAKRIAIHRAAKWLMNKNQNPWSFKPGPWPTPEEKSDIDEAFETFNRTECSLNVIHPTNNARQMGMTCEDGMDHCRDQTESPVESCNDEHPFVTTDIDHFQQSPPSSSFEDILEDLINDCEYYDVFNKVIQSGQSGDSAQTAKWLTKLVIPENKDIFVDGVQYSYQRWSCAVLGKTVEDIAEPLFRKYFKADFVARGIPFRNLDDFSPLKILAMLRAVAWIKKLKTNGYYDDSFGFDSAISDHNVFLSLQEIHKIYNYLSTKYGEGPCRPEDFQGRDTPPNTPPISLPAMSPAIQEKITCVVSPTVMTNTAPHPTAPVPCRMVSIKPMMQIQTDAQQNVIIHGCTFPLGCWNEAIRRFKLDEKSGAEKAGKYLFEETFTSKEIQNQNISGRGEKQQFLQKKIDAILGALEYIRGVIFGNGTVIPWTTSERKELTTKIFIEHSNYLRRKLKESEAVVSRMTLKRERDT